MIPLKDFEDAAKCADSHAFLALVNGAKVCMRESIDGNALEKLTAQHAVLMSALDNLASVPELASNWGIQSEAFMLPLLPLLPKNSTQAFKHLNCSPVMDAFILANKLEIGSLAYGETDSAYRVLAGKLIDLRMGEAYGQLICKMLDHAETLCYSSAERRRILKYVFVSLGQIADGMRLSTEHKQSIEALFSRAESCCSPLEFDGCAGYRLAEIPRVLAMAIEKSSFVHVGHFTKLSSSDYYATMIDFLAPHADEALFAKTFYGFARQGDSCFPALFTHHLFDSKRHDLRVFIDSYLEQSANDHPLLMIAKARIERGEISFECESRILAYLDILIGNGKHKDNFDAEKLSTRIDIPAQWIRKTSWHQVHRLSLELGL